MPPLGLGVNRCYFRGRCRAIASFPPLRKSRKERGAPKLNLWRMRFVPRGFDPRNRDSPLWLSLMDFSQDVKNLDLVGNLEDLLHVWNRRLHWVTA